MRYDYNLNIVQICTLYKYYFEHGTHLHIEIPVQMPFAYGQATKDVLFLLMVQIFCMCELIAKAKACVVNYESISYGKKSFTFLVPEKEKWRR